MTIVQNYHKYVDLRLFDPLTQAISSHSLNEASECKEIHGFFACLGGVQFVLYRQQERLMLSIEGVNTTFDDLTISTSTISRIVSQGNSIYFLRHIKICSDNKIIFENDYTESGPYFADDFTIYEAEDFDFGLFLENLSRNSERCNGIFMSP